MEPDGETDEELRQELRVACENVRNQIDLQGRSQYSQGGGHGGDTMVLQMLKDELAQLEEALANLGPGDA